MEAKGRSLVACVHGELVLVVRFGYQDSHIFASHQHSEQHRNRFQYNGCIFILPSFLSAASFPTSVWIDDLVLSIQSCIPFSSEQMSALIFCFTTPFFKRQQTCPLNFSLRLKSADNHTTPFKAKFVSAPYPYMCMILASSFPKRTPHRPDDHAPFPKRTMSVPQISPEPFFL